jgi:hypothetical protein
MLHYRLRHLFKPLLLSFVDTHSHTSSAAIAAGAVSNDHLCAQGHTCLHLSNHNQSPAAGSCQLHVRSFETGASRLAEAFGATAPAVGGAIVADFETTDLLKRAQCAAGECWLSAACEGGGGGGGRGGGEEVENGWTGGGKLEAQPIFPGTLGA